MKNYLLILLILSLSSVSFAAKVAVVDSGTDFNHSHLTKNILWSSVEIDNNRVDDDDNGKVDDVVGWNFVDNRGQVFTSEHLEYVNPLVYPIFSVIAKIQSNTATEEDIKYFEDNFNSLPTDERLLMANDLNFFGQYAHGTHVSGTVVFQNPNAEVLALRVFPDSAPTFLSKDEKPSRIKDTLYGLLASFANGQFIQLSLIHI